MTNKYNSFDELPSWLKVRIANLAAPKDPDAWIRENVPALGGSSIFQKLNTENGEQIIDEYLTKIEGYLGG